MQTIRHNPATDREYTTRKYETWGEWLDMIDARPAISCEFTSSQHNPPDFSGGWDYSETVRRLRSGWREGTARITQGAQALAVTDENAAPCPHQFETDVAGAFPDVSAYCAGEPEHMLTPAWEDPQESPVVTIVMQTAAVAKIEADDLERYGIATLSLIDATARTGKTVAVWAAFSMQSKRDKQHWHTLVPITRAGTELDRDRLAAAVHPAFFRRAYFAHTETHADHMGSVSGGYGKPQPLELEEAALEGPGILLPLAGRMPSDCRTPQSAATWITNNLTTF
jgi:hypothetical protein